MFGMAPVPELAVGADVDAPEPLAPMSEACWAPFIEPVADSSSPSLPSGLIGEAAVQRPSRSWRPGRHFFSQETVREIAETSASQRHTESCLYFFFPEHNVHRSYGDAEELSSDEAPHRPAVSAVVDGRRGTRPDSWTRS